MKPKSITLIIALGLSAGVAVVVSIESSRRNATPPPQAAGAFPQRRITVKSSAESSSIEASTAERTNWKSRANSISRIEDETARIEAIDRWLSEMSSDELIDAIALLWDQLPLDSNREIAKKFLRRLAELEPEKAAALAERLPNDSDRQAVMAEVAVVWADQDFSAAVEWINRWPDGESRQAGLIGACYEGARGHAIDALKVAVDLPASDARDDLIRHATAQWAAENPAAVADWAKQLGDPLLRERIIGTVATEWSDRDPVAAANLAVRQLSPGRILDDTVVAIVQRWVQTEPEAARSWVDQFPPGKLRAAAMDQITLLSRRP